jgi:RimJ/RimL family protein N-acetyltransferase
LLEGKAVSLRLRDKEDVDFLFEFWNNIDYYGDYEAIQPQISKTEVEKRIESSTMSDAGVVWTWFVVEKKDGAKIGFILYFTNQPRGWIELGYALLPSEMGKGYGTEAVQIMVDYLFLAKDIMRVQATTDQRNGASQRVLEKVGFKKEGIIRQSGFMRGEWVNDCLYSILREEWKEPRILTKPTQKLG